MLLKNNIDYLGAYIYENKKSLLYCNYYGDYFISILLYYFGVSDLSRQSIYEMNWDINIPLDLKSVYHNQDKHDFQGKGGRYTLFLTDDIDALPFITLKNDSVELQTFDGNSYDGRNYNIEEFVQAITTELKVPDDKRPKYDKYYEWQKFLKHGNVLIAIYFPQENKVYFVEKLS